MLPDRFGRCQINVEFKPSTGIVLGDLLKLALAEQMLSFTYTADRVGAKGFWIYTQPPQNSVAVGSEMDGRPSLLSQL